MRRVAGVVVILLITLSAILYLRSELDARAITCREFQIGLPLDKAVLQRCFSPLTIGRLPAWHAASDTSRQLEGWWGQGGIVEEWQYLVTLYVALLGGFLAAFVGYPALPGWLSAIRIRWWSGYTACAVAAGAAMLAAFVVRYGTRQFGAFDYSVMVESGWRVFQGQVPYRDYICTLPPALFLGVKLAFLLFGVRWISTTLVTAIFASGSFVWMYCLFQALRCSRLAAFLAAICIECVSMLLLCFWWYNDITPVAAVIFLLSCLLYLQKSPHLWAGGSYAASLCLLGFMKPNTAAPLILAGVILLLLATPSKIRLLLWTTAAAALNMIVLAINHVSVMGLLASYSVAMGGRGTTPWFGLSRITTEDVPRVCIAVLFLLAPVAVWLPEFHRAIQQRDRRSAARLLLLAAAVLTSGIAMCTNGDFKDVDWPLLIAAGVVLLGSSAVRWPALLRCYACFLFALTATDVYTGMARYRVRTIGTHRFFEWDNRLVSPGTPFFAGMQASPLLKTVMEQTAQVLRDAPRPVYFGPRMEFAYAAFGEPSPKDMGIWWDPTSAFAKGDEQLLEERWQRKRFPTVILLERDVTFFSFFFRRTMRAEYEPDTQWPNILVLRRKGPPADANPP